MHYNLRPKGLNSALAHVTATKQLAQVITYVHALTLAQETVPLGACPNGNPMGMAIYAPSGSEERILSLM